MLTRWSKQVFFIYVLEEVDAIWSILATGRICTMHFSGSAPQNMRFHLLNSVQTEKFILSIYFASSVCMQLFVGIKFVGNANLYNGKRKAQCWWMESGHQILYQGIMLNNKRFSPAPAGEGQKSVCSSDLQAHACDTPSKKHCPNGHHRTTGHLEMVLTGHSINSFVEIKAIPILPL